MRKFLLVVFLLIFPVFVFAQEITPGDNAAVLANTNIYRSEISPKTADGVLPVSFTITNNGEKDQSDIRFGIDVVKKTDERQIIVDSFVSDQILTLAPGESSKQEIQYQIPSFLSGEYEIWVISKTRGGLMLSLSLAGTEKFSSVFNKYVEIVTESCAFQVSGEDGKSYTLYQGVDVAQGETLLFSCDLKNHSSAPLTVAPYFETYRRTVYGDKVEMEYPAVQSIALTSKETKKVSFIIPKPSLPQAYDVSVVLTEQASKKVVSNKIVAHYVLRGISATIQTASLDKSAYAKGETISARLIWTPSADQFPGSRAGESTDIQEVIVKMSIFDQNGKSCIKPVSVKTIPNKIDFNLQAIANAVCVSPKVDISLLDATGNVLDSHSFASSQGEEPEVVQETTKPTDKDASKESPFWNIKTVIIGIIVLLFVVGLLLIIRRVISLKSNYSSNTLKSLIFVVVVASGFFMGIGEAKGVAFGVTNGTGVSVNFTATTQKNVFVTGERVRVNLSAYLSGCANALGAATADITATLLSVSYTKYFALIQYGYDYDYVSFVAPMTPGNYTIYLNGCADFSIGRRCQNVTIPITVVAPTCGSANGVPTTTLLVSSTNLCPTDLKSYNFTNNVNGWTWECGGVYEVAGSTPRVSCSAPLKGSCGSVNGTAVAVKPTTNLCSTTLGNSSVLPVSGPGPWSWTCNGGNSSSTNDDVPCSTIPLPNPIPGTCHLATNNVPTTTKPTINLCTTTSVIPTVLPVSGPGPWTWTCSGSNGGTDDPCTAPLKGSCGPADGTTVTTPPSSTDLCFTTFNTPSVSGNGPWNWTCDGSLSGSTSDDDFCSAFLSCISTDWTYTPCQCPQETRTRNNGCTTEINIECDTVGKNSCRDFNFREVAP